MNLRKTQSEETVLQNESDGAVSEHIDEKQWQAQNVGGAYRTNISAGVQNATPCHLPIPYVVVIVISGIAMVYLGGKMRVFLLELDVFGGASHWQR